MLPFLLLVPVFASLILGTIYLVAGDGPPWLKLAVVVVFAAAAYLQFGSRHALAGMLVQIALAIPLAIWHKAANRLD